MRRPTPERPAYTSVVQSVDPVSVLYTVMCDEGAGPFAVARDLLAWGAEWLLIILGSGPLPRELRP